MSKIRGEADQQSRRGRVGWGGNMATWQAAYRAEHVQLAHQQHACPVGAHPPTHAPDSCVPLIQYCSSLAPAVQLLLLPAVQACRMKAVAAVMRVGLVGKPTDT
jgi:hypothetical protein